MKRMALGCLVLSATLLACSSDSDSGGSSGGNGTGGTGGSSGQCASIDGAWTIKSHCVSSQVGTTVTVHQNGCQIESVDPWTGWSGSVTAAGGISMSGPAGTGSTMTCTGTAAGSAITMSCNPTCDVQLSR
jgi:hypothetical protein